jgi:hypothetical protein
VIALRGNPPSGAGRAWLARATFLACLMGAGPASAEWFEAEARMHGGLIHGVGGALWEEVGGPGFGGRLGLELAHVDLYMELDRLTDDNHYSLIGIGWDTEIPLDRYIVVVEAGLARVFSEMADPARARVVPHQGLTVLGGAGLELPLGVDFVRAGARVTLGVHYLSDGLVGDDGDWGVNLTGLLNVRTFYRLD